MKIINGMTILNGSDVNKQTERDYCKIHAQYYRGPECKKCKEETIKLVAMGEKAEQRPKLWL